MNILLVVAIALIGGLLLSRLATLAKLPNVTAFLIAGLLIGPSVLGLISHESLASMAIVSEAALGFIAFSIGGEFKLSHLKKIGKAPLTITAAQGLATALFIDVGLILLGFDMPTALLLGAIGLATAPAATLMVVRQYKADGPVTRMLLPVVAMDDALGLMVYSISASVAQALLGGEMTVSSMLVAPLVEIVGSLLLGVALGLILTYAGNFFRSRGNKLALTIACVLLGVALCGLWHLSSLLVCMMIGAVVVNMSNKAGVIMEQTDRFTPPMFLLFFVLSGAELDLSVLPMVGVLGAAYVILRSLGKCLGTTAGALMVKSDKNIRNYLGFTLLPQAGVAIGMAQLTVGRFPELGSMINTVVLAGVLVFELLGPIITKWALNRAGEIPHAQKSKA